MRVLIVEASRALGRVWSRHLERAGATVALVTSADAAILSLNAAPADVLVVDLALPEAGALLVSDYAAYRRPAVRVIFVSADRFFSDGSIFAHAVNACAMLPADTPPADLIATAQYYAAATPPD